MGNNHEAIQGEKKPSDRTRLSTNLNFVKSHEAGNHLEAAMSQIRVQVEEDHHHHDSGEEANKPMLLKANDLAHGVGVVPAHGIGFKRRLVYLFNPALSINELCQQIHKE